jgi:dTDP-4-amino-4,6-dideoxygalactose transaminase
MIKIPYNRPVTVGREMEYIEDAVKSGHISGVGKYTIKCEEIISRLTDSPACLLTTSCTHSLEMMAILIDIKPGDEVIIPSFTFVSTANAFALHGAKIVFCDIRKDTLNIDEKKLPELITNKTRAVVVVHYAGVACNMDEIAEVCKFNNILLLEDNAHGLTGEFKERKLGSFGTLSAQSFHETKNFSSGEGGALVINNLVYLQRAEIIREKGTNRSKFFRGEVDKYTWVDIGSSYVMSDMLAAYLLAQLEKHEEILIKRNIVWNRYFNELSEWSKQNNVLMPFVPEYCSHPSHIFYIIMPDVLNQIGLINYLKANGILSVFHYQPLHLSEMGKKYGGYIGQCPVTEYIADRIVRLPIFYDLSIEEQDLIIDVIQEYKTGS